MKKIIIISLLVLIIVPIARSQVVLNLQIPAVGVQLKSQLWNLSIINSGPSNINIHIDMVFSDAATGQQIFSARSREINLTQQITQLQAFDVSPIIYNILNQNYNVDLNPEGFLPIGNFNVCVAVFKLGAESPELVAEECDLIEIEPLTPPILVSPPDAEATDELRPFFNWLPPAPLSGFNNLAYDFVLTEVNGSQTPTDAIQQNIPIHSEQNLYSNYLAYPSSLPELDTSKTYAWQVAAKSSGNVVAHSEIWTFRVRLYGLDTLPFVHNEYYVRLKRDDNSSYVTFVNAIRFEYLNELNDSSVVVKLYDLSTSSRNAINLPEPTLQLRYGQNYFRIPVNDVNGIIHTHIYLLELINSKGEKWNLKFEYRGE